MRFAFYVALSLVICLTATSIWPEFIMPIALPASLANLPPLLKWELRLFRWTVMPPTLVTPPALRGVYQAFASAGVGLRPAGISDYMPEPTAAALEFLRAGVPFWLAIVVAFGEGARWVVRRSRRVS